MKPDWAEPKLKKAQSLSSLQLPSEASSGDLDMLDRRFGGKEGTEAIYLLRKQAKMLAEEKEKLQKEIAEKEAVHLNDRIRRTRLGKNKIIPMHTIQPRSQPKESPKEIPINALKEKQKAANKVFEKKMEVLEYE